LLIGFAVSIANRPLIEIDVLRDRNALFREVGADIENVYTLRLINKDAQAQTVHLAVRDLPGAILESERPAWSLDAGEVASATIRIRVPASAVGGGHDIAIVARTGDGSETVARTRFLAPVAP